MHPLLLLLLLPLSHCWEEDLEGVVEEEAEEPHLKYDLNFNLGGGGGQGAKVGELASSLEAATSTSARVEGLLALMELELTVSDLLLSPVGKVVRGLAGEQGEVGEKANMLLDRWKGLVGGMEYIEDH